MPEWIIAKLEPNTCLIRLVIWHQNITNLVNFALLAIYMRAASPNTADRSIPMPSCWAGRPGGRRRRRGRRPLATTVASAPRRSTTPGCRWSLPPPALQRCRSRACLLPRQRRLSLERQLSALQALPPPTLSFAVSQLTWSPGTNGDAYDYTEFS